MAGIVSLVSVVTVARENSDEREEQKLDIQPADWLGGEDTRKRCLVSLAEEFCGIVRR
ncbi:hypothetical protein [Thiorhodovibrio frisius]|uniref:hypothetical protein n=1 Tax=Thiorhodovibrio frisius TaxID=631362 RepID=UPI00167FB765|nr:hypothetical protein [Thiorhodovibrio frisius]